MIEFKKADPDRLNLSSLQGYVLTTYDELVKVFGEPHFTSDDPIDKVTAEWIIDFGDGGVASIYDWKEDETPKGLYRWHIGSYSKDVIPFVGEALQREAYPSSY